MFVDIDNKHQNPHFSKEVLKMAEDHDLNRNDCLEQCRTKYFRCTKRTLTGCVEVLRVCRDECLEKSE